MAYIGNNLTVQQYAPTIQYFSGNGSTTAFTLSIAVVTAAQIIVTVDNVIQNPSSAFTVSGTTLTFTSAPLTGTNNIWVEYTSLQTNTIQPGAGTVSYTSLNSDNQSKLGITGKNRVINGAMVVAQRGTSTTSTAFINQVDQFQVATNSGTFTFGQSTNAPANFSNSALVTNTASLTPSGTNYYSIRNVIEGLNVADLAWGSAYAKTVTLSFWVRSSVTGTFGGSVFNGSVNRSYPFTYVISSANTWEQKSITITGDTTGTWATDNTAGIYIEWALGTGSTYQGTAGVWAAARYQGATGQTQWSTTNGATFYLTGVQLEVGTQATQFTNAGNLYGGELALCQRYFWNIKKGNFTGVTNVAGYNTTDCYGVINFPVYMRTGPTGAYSSLSAFRVAINGAQPTPSAITFQDLTVGNCVLNISASVTAGAAGWLSFVSGAASTDYISWSAEL